MSTTIDDETALRGLYDSPKPLVAAAKADQLDDLCRRFIALSPLVIISSRRSHGAIDISPRGGPPGFVASLDDGTLAIPDAPGNNKVETMTNLTHDPSVGLMFIIPGIDELLRLHGRAEISTDDNVLSQVAGDGPAPKSALVVTVDLVYPHCGKAFKRARLWAPDAQKDRVQDQVPTLGQIAVAMANPPDLDAPTLDGKVAEEYAEIDAAAQRIKS